MWKNVDMKERDKKRNTIKRRMKVVRKRETDRKTMRTIRRRKKKTNRRMVFKKAYVWKNMEM